VNKTNQYVVIIDLSESLFSFATTNITYVRVSQQPTAAHEIYVLNYE
jgi:hypothetical protein